MDPVTKQIDEALEAYWKGKLLATVSSERMRAALIAAQEHDPVYQWIHEFIECWDDGTGVLDADVRQLKRLLGSAARTPTEERT